MPLKQIVILGRKLDHHGVFLAQADHVVGCPQRVNDAAYEDFWPV